MCALPGGAREGQPGGCIEKIDGTHHKNIMILRYKGRYHMYRHCIPFVNCHHYTKAVFACISIKETYILYELNLLYSAGTIKIQCGHYLLRKATGQHMIFSRTYYLQYHDDFTIFSNQFFSGWI